MAFSGMSPDGGLVEMLELPGHPYFLGTQFHPELKSRPTRAHPLFAAFIEAAVTRRDALRSASGESAGRDQMAEEWADSTAARTNGATVGR